MIAWLLCLGCLQFDVMARRMLGTDSQQVQKSMAVQSSEDNDANDVSTMSQVSVDGGDCDVSKENYVRLLTRKDSQYVIGDGRAGCVGTYDTVKDRCKHDAMQKIKDMTAMYYLQHIGSPPWLAEEGRTTTVYRAEHVDAHMQKNLVKQVVGIDSQITFDEVFNTFSSNGCHAVIWGGMVRDAMLGIESMDTDVGWFCGQSKLLSVIKKEGWGGTFKKHGKCPRGLPANLNCKQRQKPTSYVQVGHPPEGREDEGLEGKSALENILGSARAMEFTTNAVAYDPVNKILIDPTGSGVCDSLKKRVVFASAQTVSIPPQELVRHDHPSGSTSRWKKFGSAMLRSLRRYMRWASDSGKVNRLLKLVIPPKNFCVRKRTFYLIVSAWFQNFDAFSKILKHFQAHYASRSAAMVYAAREMLVEYCSSFVRGEINRASGAQKMVSLTADESSVCGMNEIGKAWTSDDLAASVDKYMQRHGIMGPIDAHNEGRSFVCSE